MGKKKAAVETESYEDILNRSWDDMPEAVILPDGDYVLKGRNATFIPPKEEGKNPRVLWFYTPEEAMDTVDEGALQEIADAQGGELDLSANQVVYQQFIEGARDWQAVRNHLAAHGVDTDGKSIKDSLKEFRGKKIVAYLGSRSYTNSAGQTVTENVPSNFTPLE